MKHATWKAISSDPEIWKKLSLGIICQSLILSIPISLGIINRDLEAKNQRSASEQDPNDSNPHPPSLDSILDILQSGIGPSLVLIAILAIFSIVSIPSGLSFFQFKAYFHTVDPLLPELHNEVQMSLVTKLILALTAALGLICQLITAATLPIAMAQYSRDIDLGPAVSPLNNVYTVASLGAAYWKSVSGVAVGILALFAYLVSSGFGLAKFPSIIVWFLINTAIFISLMLSSRMALDYLAPASNSKP